jgi:hypothetical protein
VLGDGGSLVTDSAGSVSTQRKAFKYVIIHLIFKTGHGKFAIYIKIYFL